MDDSQIRVFCHEACAVGECIEVGHAVRTAAHTLNTASHVHQSVQSIITEEFRE